MADFNFMVSTEGLQDKGDVLCTEASNIRSALRDIDSARRALDGWISRNKEKYDSKVAADIPKLEEMADSVSSFGNVAKKTSSRIVDVENRIAAALDNDNIAA